MQGGNQQRGEAERRLAELRAAIARYRKARQRTSQVIMEARGIEPHEAAKRVQAMRDTKAERRAAQELVDLNRILLGRDPSDAELEVGVSGLGLLPMLPIIAVPAIIGGAWSATSLFNYLSEREQRIQREIDPTSIMGPASVRWILPAGLAAALLVGGYIVIKSALKKPKRNRKDTARKVTAHNKPRNQRPHQRSRSEKPESESDSEEKGSE